MCGWSPVWAGTLVFCLCLQSVNSAVEFSPCPEGWFGFLCHYQCHCDNRDTCDPFTGHCMVNSSCELGWFGPSCQYQDALAWSEVPQYLKDKDDETCNPDTGQSVTLNITVDITWLRVVTNDTVTAGELSVHFEDGLPCDEMVRALVDYHILDIYCANGHQVHSLTLTGPAVPTVCSLYVSAGRNVALMQDSSQSSVAADTGGSHRAVDGVIAHSVDGMLCAQTSSQHWGADASWTLTFNSRAYVLNRIIIQNVGQSPDMLQTLRGFRLELYDGQGELITTYRDDVESEGREVYDVHLPYTIPVRRLELHAGTRRPNQSYSLHLCEVQLFGEAECPPGRYGLECELTCDLCLDQQCMVSTGACVACPAGRTGFFCHMECLAGTYGNACALVCPSTCYENHCDVVDGTCESCLRGYQGTHCDTATVAGVLPLLLALLTLLLLPLLALLIRIWRRRRSRKKKKTRLGRRKAHTRSS